MVPVDEEKIAVLISELSQALQSLRRLGGIPQAEFLSDEDKVASAKYNFVVAIEAAIDMTNHAVAKLSLRRPEDYADSFRVLGEAGAFDRDLTDRLMAMARFRNRLYFKVDDSTVRTILEDSLGDLDRFLDQFRRFVSV